MFVDRVEIEVRGGDGGSGCVSFRREKYVPKGGPDGGDGGHGGSVVLVASPKVNNLASLSHQRFWRAQPGSNGSGSNRAGKSAPDMVIEVPPGTVIIDAVAGFVMKDLTREGEQVVVARGGDGGKGNTRFKTAQNRAPRESTPGGRGERRSLVLELKVIADVGLIGKPNAGKSTMLSRLTRARPEIADYPFTTKHPNLGIVQIDMDRQFVMADIPGLIEGAHAGVGLGHEFLRHVERAGILVHLVEPTPADGSDPLENYRVIRSELEQYDPQLAHRREIVCVTKAELPDAAAVRDALATMSGAEPLLVSAVTGQNLDKLIGAIWSALEESRAQAAVAAPAPIASEAAAPETTG